MKKIVIYKSVSGFTKKYAERIAHEIDAELFDIKDINFDGLSKYDIIVFGGALHAAGINGLNTVKKYLTKLHNKKIIIFATGAGPYKPGLLDEIKSKNLTSDQQKKIRFFYLRGGFDFSKLTFEYKIMMTIFKWIILSKKDKTPDEKGMLEAFKKPADFTKKENTKEILEYIDSLK